MASLTPRADRHERNYIINGALDYRQRSATGQSINTTPNYRVHDRFITYINNAGFFNSSVQGPTNITDSDSVEWNAINMNCNASDSNAEAYIVQRIEADNLKQLVKAGKMSLSFLMRNNNFTTVAVNFYYPTAKDNYSGQTLFHTTADQVFTADSTLKEVKFEDISVPVAAGTNGMAVEIVYKGFTLSTADDTAITKIMLNAGPTAANFNRAGKDVGEELVICQRYYEKSYELNVTPGTSATNGREALVTSATFHRHSFRFSTPKRAIPTVIVYGHQNGVANQVQRDGGGAVTVSNYAFSETGGSFQSGSFAANVEYSGQWTADAEL